jgi:nucleoid-associated protein YgaU
MAAYPKGFQQARLELETGKQIPCWFNPREYAVSKSNAWKIKEIVGAGLPSAQFGGGQPRELTLELMFDASDVEGRDVRAITDQLLAMMEVDPSLARAAGTNRNAGRPPMLTFVWGRTSGFSAVAKQVSIQYTLFDVDGSPLRAQARLTLVQVERATDGTSGRADRPPGQNPTTRAVGGVSTHTVRDGDTLPALAYSAYGDPTRWREIADANDIADPLALARGAVLLIPPSA